MAKYRQLALRLAIYINALGAELRPLEGADFRVHLASLKRQYIDLRRTLDPEAVRLARIAARVRIRNQGLSIAAEGLISFQSSAPKQSAEDLAVRQEADNVAGESMTRLDRTQGSQWKTSRGKLEAFFSRPGQTVLRCPKCRMQCGLHKKSYPSRDLAEDAKIGSRYGRKLVVYVCYCQPGYWHLGHSRRKKTG